VGCTAPQACHKAAAVVIDSATGIMLAKTVWCGCTDGVVSCCTAKEDYTNPSRSDPPVWVLQNTYCYSIEGCPYLQGCFVQMNYTCHCEP
jgi:hypothetical protein